MLRLWYCYLSLVSCSQYFKEGGDKMSKVDSWNYWLPKTKQALETIEDNIRQLEKDLLCDRRDLSELSVEEITQYYSRLIDKVYGYCI